MTRKPFDQKLYNEQNDRAINCVLQLLNSDGFYAVRNDDKYGPDIVVYRGFRPHFYLEVEVKLVWKADQPFPWQEINLPGRKAKFLNLGLPIEFWILREDLAESVIIPDYVITSSGRSDIVPNRYIESGEEFYKIPVSECIYRRLDVEEEDTTEEVGQQNLPGT